MEAAGQANETRTKALPIRSDADKAMVPSKPGSRCC
jgi:hypothetical protein